MSERKYLHHFYTPSKTARESLFYVESVGHYWCDKSFFEDSYYNQNYYIVYVVSGNGYVYTQNGKTLVSPGQLIFMNLSQPYKFYSHKKKPWEFLWILYGGKDAEWYYNTITNKNRILFNIQSDSIIPTLLTDIYNLYESKDPFVEFRTSLKINNILTELYIDSMTESKTKKNELYQFPDPIKIVMDFVEQNYFRKISLNELASITYLSPYYLLRLFKKYTGYTPGEYIKNFRLDYSKKLLLKPEMTIEQIALFLGFNTHSYFSKIFKDNAGLTPDQFRKKYL